MASKTDILTEYGHRYKLNTLIETGLDNSIGSGMAAGFPSYIALDYNEENVRLAQEQGFDARCGDSGYLLRELLSDLHEPALFWLDAHGLDCTATTRITLSEWPGWEHLPLLRELRAIGAWPHAEHSVVLIDDMPAMAQWIGIGTTGHPSGHAFERFLDEQPVPWRRETGDGIMRLTPP